MLLRAFTEPQEGADYATQLRVARAAEQLGFDGFFRSDHYMASGPGIGLPGPTDAWITLAGLALQTDRIRLGTLVSPVTFRYPGPLAISVAQVDQMSGGRVELGLGTGWFDDEHHAYGHSQQWSQEQRCKAVVGKVAEDEDRLHEGRGDAEQKHSKANCSLGLPTEHGHPNQRQQACAKRDQV